MGDPAIKAGLLEQPVKAILAVGHQVMVPEEEVALPLRGEPVQIQGREELVALARPRQLQELLLPEAAAGEVAEMRIWQIKTRVLEALEAVGQVETCLLTCLADRAQ